MRRREFMTVVGAAAAWSLAARAQQPAMPVVGFLNSRPANDSAHLVAAFRQGLKETGYLEGSNLTIEYRWAEGHYDRLSALAADLVRRQVTVIVAAGGNDVALTAKEMTTTIPTVVVVGSDPVALGLVASFNRPGGNITGVSVLNNELVPKLLEVLLELLPKARTIAFLMNPNNSAAANLSLELKAAAHGMGQQVHILNAGSEIDFEPVLAALVQLRADALLVHGDPFFNSRAEQFVAIAARCAVPAIYSFREYVAAGGLMSYGTSLTDAYRQTGIYTGRIVKGDKPADLPVHQLVKVELVINLKTAKTLGLTFPNTLLGRADEVIE
jgi:putative ABC transport system substrate-binding protein